jgi:hypothetical protein
MAVLLVGYLGPISDASGQDQPTQPVLPDLAPREVEIRGQLQIAFPSLRRQPLVGFNPPPRVPDIPAERRPTLESYSEAGATVARTPLEKPDPPGVAALSGEAPIWMEAEIATGRYFTRLVRGIASRQIGNNRQIDIALRYEGSDGHTIPSDTEEIRNVSDDLTASVAYSVRTSRILLSAAASGFVSSYSLFGIDNSSGGAVRLNPDRDASHGALRLFAGAPATSRTTYSIGATLERSKVSSNLFSSQTIVDPSTERTEKRASLDASLGFPIGAAEAYAEGSASWSGLDTDGLFGSDVRHAEAGVGFTRRTDRLRVKAGPRIMTVGFEADAGGVVGEARTATYLSADVDLSYRYGGVLTVVGTNRPIVRSNTLADLLSSNPYVVDEPAMQPSILDVNVEAGLLFSSGRIQFKASAQLKRSPNWAFFSNSTGSGASTVAGGFFGVGYAEARVTSVGGEMAISLPAELQLSSTVYVHDTELTNLGVQIPYHPRLSAQLGLSFPFASRRGIVQVTGRFIGERQTDITETATADPYLDVDVYARYDVRPNVGIVFRLQNLGINDHEVWDRYPQSPSIVMGGVRVLW